MPAVLLGQRKQEAEESEEEVTPTERTGVQSQATDGGNLDLLVAATVAMAAIVVTINRLVWRRLYRLAESRFRLET
jgi:ABC-type anion transport system duplicated permease subunit